MTLGILAYGSLLADPGEEIAAATAGRIPVTTPFCVEYARSSRGRAGAPTLVSVPEGGGARVAAQILLIEPGLSAPVVRDMLFRRETNRVGNRTLTYSDDVQRAEADAVVIKVLQDLAGVPTVFYAALKANIPEIVSADLSSEAKAERLAELAISSVTQETYQARRDGIRYLADAIEHGIRTPLTDLYRDAVLRRAGGAPDLEMARMWTAQRRHLALEDEHE